MQIDAYKFSENKYTTHILLLFLSQTADGIYIDYFRMLTQNIMSYIADPKHWHISVPSVVKFKES